MSTEELTTEETTSRLDVLEPEDMSRESDTELLLDQQEELVLRSEDQ